MGLPQRTSTPTAVYPPFPEQLPADPPATGTYALTFARTLADRDAILRLRFAVFNLEMNEGLDSAYVTGRDEDIFDDACHHLLIRETTTGEVVGTYRLQTHTMARRQHGFYSATEFDLSQWPNEVLDKSVELGRACIAQAHRSLQVLYLMWQGIGMYLAHNQKRYLFGCCSLTSQDPVEGLQVLAYLEEKGYLHPTLRVTPQPAYACTADPALVPPPSRAKLPRLMRVYLSLGATICGPPALDQQFKTIDYLAFFDVESLDQRAMAYYKVR